MVLEFESVDESRARVRNRRLSVSMTADMDTHVCSGRWTSCRSRAPRELLIGVGCEQGSAQRGAESWSVRQWTAAPGPETSCWARAAAGRMRSP
jgi:hypothetical protein